MGSGHKFEQTFVLWDQDKSSTEQKREIIEFVTFVENIVEVCSEEGVGIVDGNAENADGDDGGIKQDVKIMY